MGGSSIHSLEIIFLILLVFIVVLANLARRLDKPYPIVMVVGGLLLGLIPSLPHVHLNPDVIFLVFLPPLLYAAAWLTSWRDFTYNLVSICLLAFGLVGFTVVGIGSIAPIIFNGFTWESGIVLGAVVAATDAIAATSIAKQIGLSKRIIDILEGESLVNDASGLLALEFGLAMIVRGEHPTIGFGIWRIFFLTVGGIAVGLLVGWLIFLYERLIDDGPIEIVISLFVPYASYLAAEWIHASGVLAVVTSGLFLSRQSPHLFSSGVRLQLYAVWTSFTFTLNGIVFVLIGLQLPAVLDGLREYTTGQLFWYGAIFSVVVIALRLIWIYPGAAAAFLIRTRILKQPETFPPLPSLFVVGWTGMRGVVSLAAALSLPPMLASGQPFAQRNMIIFLTFSAIFVTLVLQGLTLPWVIGRLGLGGVPGPDQEEIEGRRVVLEKAIEHVNQSPHRSNESLVEMYEDMERHLRHQLAAVTGEYSEEIHATPEIQAHFQQLSRDLISIQRDTALRLRNERRISDEILRLIERDLDINEASQMH